MKNKNLPYLIGGGLLLLGVGGYFLYKYIKDQKDLKDSRKEGQDEKTPIGEPTSTTTSTPVSNLSDSFPISKGTMKNKNVQDLQKILQRDANGNLLEPDGSWGKLTEGAMAKFGYGNRVVKNQEDLKGIISDIQFKIRRSPSTINPFPSRQNPSDFLNPTRTTRPIGV
jgi:hypothetical protein